MDTSEERLIKGSVVMHYVKMIRSNPDLPWPDHLLPEDMEMVGQMILPASWYSMEFFQRIGVAVFKLIAKEDYALSRAFGRSLADDMHAKHPGMISKGKPRNTLEKYLHLQRRFYSFKAFDVEDPGPFQIIVHAYSKTSDQGVKVYIEQQCGVAERLIELSGHPEPVMKITDSTNGDQVKHTVQITWGEKEKR